MDRSCGYYVFYLIVRVYEQIFGWRAGLDSFAPEFQTYWLSVLWTEIPLELVAGIGLAGYLWKTRTRDMASVTPRQEMKAIIRYSVASFSPWRSTGAASHEQDATGT